MNESKNNEEISIIINIYALFLYVQLILIISRISVPLNFFIKINDLSFVITI